MLHLMCICMGVVHVASRTPMKDNIESTMLPHETCTHDIGARYTHEYIHTELQSVKLETVVTTKRLAATIMLSRAALSLPTGDFVETGLFKGGTAILMLHMLQHFDTCDKQFYGFDSFEGLPKPSDQDARGSLAMGKKGKFSYGIDGVWTNFQNAGIDPKADHIHLIKGFFTDTVPNAPVKEISFLRLDGDLYVSTWDPLVHLYDKVVLGGYVYVDDYGSYNGCKEAVDLFRKMQRITEPMHKIVEPRPGNYTSYEAVWWKKGFHEEFDGEH